MRPFIISVDTTCDLPEEYLQEHGIPVHPLHYLIDDKEYGKELGELPPHEFYQVMRDGKMPMTNATNIDHDIQLMENAVMQGYDILHLPFSSAMSASCGNATLAADQVMDRHPEARIVIVDSLSATAGLGILIRKAVAMKEEGKTLEEVTTWVKKTAPHVVCHFTLPDLFHMWRGGRLKKSSAVIGTALHLHPILHVNEKGGLSAIKKNIHYSYLSPTLGAHSGPDTLAIGYIGTTR